MLPYLFALVLTAPPQTAPVRGEDARALVTAAVRAVEGDSAPRVRARFAARVNRNPNDRGALLALATFARLQYDYPTAERQYRSLIASGRDLYTVYAHIGLAEFLDERSEGRKVRPELDQALLRARELGNRVAEAEALIYLAFVRGRLEGVQVAEAILDSVSRMIPDTSYVLRARLHGRNAITHALRGRASESSWAADSAIRFGARSQIVRAEAEAYRMFGQVLQYRGQWDSAMVALQKSEERYLRARHRSAVAGSMIWHAQVLGSQARYGEMRAVMQRALTEGSATHNPGAVGDAYRAFGVIASMFGDWPAAAANFERSAAMSAELGDSSGLMTTRKYLAKVALVAGDVARAKRLTLERLENSTRTQDAGARYEAQRMLAAIAEHTGDAAAGAAALADARAQLPRLPGASYRVWLLHDDARNAAARGDLDAAVRLFESFLAGDAGGIGHLLQFDGRVRLADVFARRGDVARAERELVRATDELDQARATLTDAQLRMLAFQIVATVDAAAADPDAIAASFARVIAATVKAGRVDAALALAERWRAREFMDRLTRAAASRDEQPLAVTGASSVARSPQELRAALPDERMALLQYVAAEDAPVTLFVVQRGRIDARVLAPLDSIKPGIARMNTIIAAGGNPTALSRTLGAALLDAAVPLLDARVTHLVVVPDGPLHRVPFDALRTANGRYLIERFATSVAPSASVAASLWARPAAPRSTTPANLLAFGDPASVATATARSRSAPTTGIPTAEPVSDLPRLKGAAREARLVARYAPVSEVRLGRDASAAYLKQTDLRRFHVLHFATHAIVDEQSITGTALALAGSAGESGFVHTGDLAALKLNANLVVLSACSSAGGALARGEGVQGLASSLLLAGARSLLATAWRIPDEAVVPLVNDFYGALARGLPVADALRATKLQALRDGAPLQTWAAFIAIGDPLVTVPLREPSRPWWSAIFTRR